MKIETRKVRNPADLERALAIRREVFVGEQGVAITEEVDGLDGAAEHYLLIADNRPIATARVRYSDIDTAKIERVAVTRTSRGKGLGSRIMNFIESSLVERGCRQAVLDSQIGALGFYEKLGYKPVGQTFEEAGIPHIKMTKKLV
jgi:predicted GNAT family N-acyltransferase